MVASGKSQKITIGGMPFSIEIYRFQGDTTYTLELADQENTSHVWNEEFDSDTEACDTGIVAINSVGAVAFMRGDKVVPFRRQAVWRLEQTVGERFLRSIPEFSLCRFP